MAQLRPSEYYPISRQLYDPSDATTYYVQALIRNENTDATIATVNLDNKGNQLFVYRWQVPPDVSGLGYWISIMTRVYTDSGYTTLSQNHEQNLQAHLVLERTGTLGGGGGGGGYGESVNYKKIGELIDKSVRQGLNDIANKLEASAPVIKTEKVDMNAVLGAIADVANQIRDLPTPEAVNFAPMLQEMKRLERVLLPPKPTPPTDLGPLETKIAGAVKMILRAIQDKKIDLPISKEDIAGMRNVMQALQGAASNFSTTVSAPPPAPKKPPSYANLFAIP